MNLEYLGRGLDQRVSDAREAINKSLEAIMRQNNANGRLASGMTLSVFKDDCIASFERFYKDALQFSHNVAGSHDPELADVCARCGSAMVGVIMDAVSDRANRTGINGSVVPNQLVEIRGRLEDKRNRLTDDFLHGMMGSDQMKREPSISIINQNSPGAIQQVGLNNSSQTAQIQNSAEFTSAVNQLLASPEIAALPDEKKLEIADIADLLKAEAETKIPEVGKLRRWGAKFLKMCGEAGVKIGSHAAAQILIRILGI